MAYWVARRDFVKAGYRPETSRITSITGQLTDEDVLLIRDECVRMQSDMQAWALRLTPPRDGTVRSLLDEYQTDEDSPFRALRPDTRKQYEWDMRVLVQTVGSSSLSAIRAKDLTRWFGRWKEPKEPGGPERLRRAHGLITMLRIAVNWGAANEIGHCERLATIMARLEFATAKPRRQVLTAAHAEAIIAKAREMGLPSIALAQAFQFETALRQRDVIGEWIGINDPGMSDVTDGRQKWLRGIRWNEIIGTILRHETSKTGQEVEFDLARCPMVMAEIARVPEERRAGPIVVSEATGMPYRVRHFASVWRRVADAAGVPRSVWNMDSRAGAISEATSAGAPLEAVRHASGHSNTATTARYSRDTLAKTATVSELRVRHRTGGKNER